MRFFVEPWAPEYGSPVDDAVLAPSTADVDPGVEVEPAAWAPMPPAGEAAGDVLFVDGVRRIDAHVWIDASSDKAGASRHGICASYAAGAVRCRGEARLAHCEVRRRLFTSATGASDVATRFATYAVHTATGDDVEELSLVLQADMAALEGLVAADADSAGMVVLDGPIGRRDFVTDAVGYVKTHRMSYLPPECQRVIADLGPGGRTPLFVIDQHGRSLFSWYVRLPGQPGGARLSGTVRCEMRGDRPVADAAARADEVAATVTRFASRPHREPRAPQNLYPIAGLEAELRRRLGDRDLLYRALRAASAPASSP